MCDYTSPNSFLFENHFSRQRSHNEDGCCYVTKEARFLLSSFTNFFVQSRCNE